MAPGGEPDETGPFTLVPDGRAAELLPLVGVEEADLADAALLSSLADDTPEGRSIVTLGEERYGLAPRELDDAVLCPSRRKRG